MEDIISHPRTLDSHDPEYALLAASHRTKRVQETSTQPLITIVDDESNSELPPILRILNYYFSSNDKSSLQFIKDIPALHDLHAFSTSYPILSNGHTFTVRAIPFTALPHQDSKRLNGHPIHPGIFCVKTPNLTAQDYRDDKKAFRREYNAAALQELRALLHPRLRRCENVISLLGLDFLEDEEEDEKDGFSFAWPVFLMEYAEFGSFSAFLQDIPLELPLERGLLLDIARGLQVLHTCAVIHGDVNAENILICAHSERGYIAKLSGFGFAVIDPDLERGDHRLRGGSFLWSAPEWEQELSIEGLKKTDVFSFGLLVWRVLSRCENPWSSLPLVGLGIEEGTALRDVVARAKVHDGFRGFVVETMGARGGVAGWVCEVVGWTLGREAGGRSLQRTVEILSEGRVVVSAG